MAKDRPSSPEVEALIGQVQGFGDVPEAVAAKAALQGWKLSLPGTWYPVSAASSNRYFASIDSATGRATKIWDRAPGRRNALAPLHPMFLKSSGARKAGKPVQELDLATARRLLAQADVREAGTYYAAPDTPDGPRITLRGAGGVMMIAPCTKDSLGSLRDAHYLRCKRPFEDLPSNEVPVACGNYLSIPHDGLCINAPSWLDPACRPYEWLLTVAAWEKIGGIALGASDTGQ